MIAGVFVGGGSRRMGGRPKALLPALGEEGTLVERAVRLARAAADEVVLVGTAAYELPSVVGALEVVPDARHGAGPLAGLVAFLERAGRGGHARALALACDLPYVGGAFLAKLTATAAARADEPVAVAAAEDADAVVQPFVASYDVAACLPVARRRLDAGELALRGLLVEVGATPVAAAEGEVDDWDRPEDVARVYAFEGLEAGAFGLVPLAARRALDVAGCKLSLAAWRTSPLRARRAIAALGSAPDVVAERVRDVVREAGVAVTEVAFEGDPEAPSDFVRAALGAERARAAWDRLTPLARYALVKVARKGELERVRAAFEELAR